MRLSICIATMDRRESLLSRMLWGLQSQPGLGGAFEILVYGGIVRVGEKLDSMFAEARGSHVVFFGDDDYVTADYMSTVLPLLDVDFVGHRLIQTVDGRYAASFAHDARYKSWRGPIRGVTPIMPIRRELALQVPFPDGYEGDKDWSLQVGELVETSTFVDKVLYFYDFQSEHRFRDVGKWPYDPALVRWL